MYIYKFSLDSFLVTIATPITPAEFSICDKPENRRVHHNFRYYSRERESRRVISIAKRNLRTMGARGVPWMVQ